MLDWSKEIESLTGDTAVVLDNCFVTDQGVRKLVKFRVGEDRCFIVNDCGYSSGGVQWVRNRQPRVETQQLLIAAHLGPMGKVYIEVPFNRVTSGKAFQLSFEISEGKIISATIAPV